MFLVFLGNLYGLEKFWAFLKYYKGKAKFEIKTELKDILHPFKEVDDFRKEVGFLHMQKPLIKW